MSTDDARTPTEIDQIAEDWVTTLAELEKQGIKIDSIESMDGGAQAEIRDGEIVVRVINPADVEKVAAPSSGTGWYIRSSVKKTGGGGPLQ